MSGRHRLNRPGRRVRRLLAGTVPVLVAAGVAAAVVLGGGAVADPAVTAVAPAAAPPAPVAPAAPVVQTAAGSAGGAVPAWLREAAAPGPLDGIAADAASTARDRAEQRAQEARKREAERQATAAGGTCDLEGPPRFDDPAHPNEITNRGCGYVDGQGRERSQDPWIDGQLLSAYGE